MRYANTLLKGVTPLLFLLGSAGCSLSVKSTLDDKGPAPESECGSHADCAGANVECRATDDGTTQYNVCACAFGFVEDGSGDCVWDAATGVVKFPGFNRPSDWPAEDTDEVTDVWMVRGDGEIDENDSGDGDPGIARIEDLCDYTEITQLINLSPREVTGPMVVEVEYFFGDDMGWSPGGNGHPIAVGIDGNWVAMHGGDGWVTRRACLGHAGSGQDIELSVGALGTDSANVFCSSGGGGSLLLDVTRLEILPADPGECAETAGTIENPDFEAANGWSLNVGSGDGRAEIAAGEGEGGTQGLFVGANTGCVQVEASTPMSWPDDVDQPLALSFWVNGEAGQNLEIRSGAIEIGSYTGTGSAERVSYCLPPWLLGSGGDLTFGSETIPWLQTICNDGFQIDNIRLESAAECDSLNGAPDAGFEVLTNPQLRGPTTSYTTGTLSIGPEETLLGARTGEVAFHHQSSHDCHYLSGNSEPKFYADSSIADEVGGNALAFWYLAEDLSFFQLRSSLDGSEDWVDTSESTWQRHTVCLPQNADGRPVQHYFVFQPSNPCGTNMAIPTESVWIDDLAVYSDPACN